MPDYLYICECGQKQDISHSIHVEPQVLCPKCGKGMQRRPGGISIQFKAGGFYSVDSKNSGSAS